MLANAQVLSPLEFYYGVASTGVARWNSEDVVMQSGLHVRVWIESPLGSNSGPLRGAIYDALGNRVSAIITFDTGRTFGGTNLQSFDVLATADGGFTVGLLSEANSQSMMTVRHYSANGELEWSTQFANSALAGTIALTEATGNRTIVATDLNYGISAFILGANGESPPNGFWLTQAIPRPGSGGSTINHYLGVAASTQLADGRSAFIVAEPSEDDIWLVFVSADGTQVGSRILLFDEPNPSVFSTHPIRAIALSDGGLAVLWKTDQPSGDQVLFKIVSANGTLSSAFEIAGAATEDWVTAVELPDGTLVIITYDDSNGITSLRQFSLAGAPLGQPFPISNSGLPLDAELGLDGSLIVTFRTADLVPTQWATRIYLSSAPEFTGTGAADALTGTAAGERLAGNAGDDILHGLGGADLLDGGAGNDHLLGGAGTDWYLVDTLGDLVFEALGGGVDTVTSTTNHYLHANVENLVLASDPSTLNNPPAIFGVGNELANSIIGSRGANQLLGGAGNDTISGIDGADSLFGEDGDDILNGDAGVDYLVGGAGHDILHGDADADALYGESGDDRLSGGLTFHTDILVGGTGNDTLDGISGQANPDYDLMDGGTGDDTYWVDTGDDLTFEAIDGGTDTVHANVTVANAGVYLYPNVENLVLEGTTAFGVGNELNNQLTGSASGNWLLGGAGSDRITGMAGNDVLFGEGGADTFVFGTNSGADVIGDFSIAQDVIEFAAYFTSFAQAQANFVQVGNDGAIDLGSGNLIVLHGVTMANLTAANFIFVASAAEAPKAAAPVMEGLSFSLEPADAFAGHGLERWQAEFNHAVIP